VAVTGALCGPVLPRLSRARTCTLLGGRVSPVTVADVALPVHTTVPREDVVEATVVARARGRPTERDAVGGDEVTCGAPGATAEHRRAVALVAGDRAGAGRGDRAASNEPVMYGSVVELAGTVRFWDTLSHLTCEGGEIDRAASDGCVAVVWPLMDTPARRSNSRSSGDAVRGGADRHRSPSTMTLLS